MALQLLDKGMDKDGNTLPIRLDSAGRTKISHGQPDFVDGIIDVVNDQVAVNLDGFSDAVFYFRPTGSHIVTFEQSPDSTNGVDGNWYPILAFNQGTSVAAAVTATMTTLPVTYRVSAPSSVYARARVTTRTTAGNVLATAAATTAAAQPQLTATLSSAAVTLASTTLLPSATVGGTITPYFNPALTAKAAVKTAAGSLLHIHVYNPNTTDVYLQMFATALASVTPGTTVPIRSYRIPASGTYIDDFTYYQRYATAITIAPWSVPSNTAGAAPTTGLVVNLEYI